MRDGRIEQIGAPNEIYDRPKSRFVASFIGTSNFFRGRVGDRHGGAFAVDGEDGVRLTVEGDAPPGGDALVAVRPEFIHLAAGAAVSGPNQFATVVEQVVYRGQHTQYLLRRATGEPLIAIRHGVDAPTDAPVLGLQPGSAVVASWDASRTRLVGDEA
jgi:putative spermidine/putrescine transport system ATP-binding protein